MSAGGRRERGYQTTWPKVPLCGRGHIVDPGTALEIAGRFREFLDDAFQEKRRIPLIFATMALRQVKSVPLWNIRKAAKQCRPKCPLAHNLSAAEQVRSNTE